MTTAQRTYDYDVFDPITERWPKAGDKPRQGRGNACRDWPQLQCVGVDDFEVSDMTTAQRTYDDYDVFDPITERWPKAGDKLLSPGRDTFLAEDHVERNYRLLRGYKRAGDILIQQALAERSDSKNLVFPALFNYRHYIELALKAIIDKHGKLVGVCLQTKNHKLPDLWQSFVKIDAAFGNDCSDIATEAVGECIREIDGVDNASATVFRYAQTKSGDTPDLPKNRLDLVRLHDVMNGIENFFECADLDFTCKVKCAAAAAEYL